MTDQQTQSNIGTTNEKAVKVEQLGYIDLKVDYAKKIGTIVSGGMNYHIPITRADGSKFNVDLGTVNMSPLYAITDEKSSTGLSSAFVGRVDLCHLTLSELGFTGARLNIDKNMQLIENHPELTVVRSVRQFDIQICKSMDSNPTERGEVLGSCKFKPDDIERTDANGNTSIVPTYNLSAFVPSVTFPVYSKYDKDKDPSKRPNDLDLSKKITLQVKLWTGPYKDGSTAIRLFQQNLLLYTEVERLKKRPEPVYSQREKSISNYDYIKYTNWDEIENAIVYYKPNHRSGKGGMSNFTLLCRIELYSPTVYIKSGEIRILWKLRKVVLSTKTPASRSDDLSEQDKDQYAKEFEKIALARGIDIAGKNLLDDGPLVEEIDGKSQLGKRKELEYYSVSNDNGDFDFADTQFPDEQTSQELYNEQLNVSTNNIQQEIVPENSEPPFKKLKANDGKQVPATTSPTKNQPDAVKQQPQKPIQLAPPKNLVLLKSKQQQESQAANTPKPGPPYGGSSYSKLLNANQKYQKPKTQEDDN